MKSAVASDGFLSLQRDSGKSHGGSQLDRPFTLGASMMSCMVVVFLVPMRAQIRSYTTRTLKVYRRLETGVGHCDTNRACIRPCRMSGNSGFLLG